MRLLKTTTVFCLLSFFAQGQEPLQKGFTLLENGNFAAAKTFFENTLKTEPSNKTAQICYGRAVGLSGNPKRPPHCSPDYWKPTPMILKSPSITMSPFCGLSNTKRPNPCMKKWSLRTQRNLGRSWAMRIP